MAYSQRVIDVPFVVLDESTPEHGGPEGRLTSMRDVQVTHYTPANTREPSKLRLEQREAFVSMPATLRDSATGAVDGTVDWSNPELLATLGDQLLSINNSKPRVWNGTNWTSYGAARVVTNKLSQNVLHTTNHVLQAPDSARIGTVTCFTWTETTPNAGGTQYQPTIAFRADDGAWVRTPFNPFANAPGQPTTIVRVVSDGTFFWVFSVIPIVGKVGIWVYDTNGAQVATDTSSIGLVWGSAPGYWDIAAPLAGALPFVALIQPAANTSVGANVGVTYWKFTVSGSVITIAATGALTGTVAAKCQGPLAFLGNDGNVSRMCVATVGAANTVFAYECNLAMGVINSEFAFGAVLNGSGIPDSLTGWGESAGGANVAVMHVAYSMLSNFAPSAGPKNDPGLRYVRSYACTSGGAVTLTNQTNGVLLSSRAFRIDNDWYAATYYQSGGGLARGASAQLFPFTLNDATDYFIGDSSQPLRTQITDVIVGSAITGIATPDRGSLIGSRVIVYNTQAGGPVSHNAGDSAVAATRTWTFLNATFALPVGSGSITAYNSILRISGSSHSGNNGDFRVVKVVSATVVITEPISSTGNLMVDDTLVGVTLLLVGQTVIGRSRATANTDDPLFPGNASQYYSSGTITVTSAQNPLGGATATINRAIAGDINPQWTPGLIPAGGYDSFLCNIIAAAAGPLSTGFQLSNGEFFSVTLTNANRWGLFSETIYPQDVGGSLVVTGTPQNNGSFPITSQSTLGFSSVALTGTQASLVPQLLLPPLPSIALQLAVTSQAFTLHCASATFDASWLLAYVTIFDSVGVDARSKGTYQVVNVLGTTDIQLTPVDGKTGQRTSTLSIDAHNSISVTKTNNQPSATQPTWFLMPLSMSQRVAGRWEWGQAFGDWRYDGETKANTGTMERNGFPLALSSVVASADGLQFVLPYRAQSFTAGQVQDATQTQTGLSIAAQSTVGLKLFNISAAHGTALAADGEMLLPGTQATQFSANGFPEDGIGIGFELPFFVSKSSSGSALRLTAKATYQYVVDIEVTGESGDRTWSTVSQALEVTLVGTEDTVTIGGRMPGPTNRVVGVSIYRVAWIGGVPTIQHYKITNDLDVNGAGFTFSTVNGGAAFDTWQFVDTVPDAQIVNSEVVYTDKALLQRFPAPAFSQGVSGWKARDWVVGYDGAVWMSGEKVEGDSTWWHPAFRYTTFGDDTPMSVCPIDDYLIVHCKRTVWYIPATQFPDATGRNGTLPNPVQLPMQNGGTGFALAIRAGVVYSSSAGGAWLITRALENVWLSENVRDSLTNISGMTIDGKQRLVITTNTPTTFVYDQVTKTWWEWSVPGGTDTALQVATLQGQVVYASSFASASLGSPILYTPNFYFDLVRGAASGIAMDVTYASLEFGSVRSFKCLWAVQIVGVYYGPHRLNAIMSYPDDDHAVTTYPGFVPTGSGPYIFEINPMLEEASAYGLRIYTDFVGVGTPGRSCALEMASFEVGVEGGLNRMTAVRRIPGT